MKYKRIAIFLVFILIIFGLIFTFLPTILVRHLIESEFEKIGIKHDGIDTVNMNLLTGEFWAGPLKVRTSESAPGQLGEIGVDISLLPLINKRAMVDIVLIKGIDIEVSRNRENIITLNGITLNQFFAKDDEGDSEKEDKDEPWGFGLSNLDLVDSRLLFVENTGGILEVEIDRLSLRNFQSWNPEGPGVFDLVARVNEIEFSLKGRATPFADNIKLEIDGEIKEANLPSVIKFTGPLGFKRKDGVFNGRLKHKITIFENGRIEGETSGDIQVLDLDYEREGEFSVKLDKTDIRLNTGYKVSENNDIEINGNLSTDVSKLLGWAGEDSIFESGRSNIELMDLKLTIGADKSFEISSETKTILENTRYSGPIHLSPNTLLEVLKYIQSLSTAGEVAVEDLSSEYPLDGNLEIPPSDIVGDKVISNSSFSLKSKAGNLSFKTAGSTEGTAITYSALDRENLFGMLRGEFKYLNIESNKDEVSINLETDAQVGKYKLDGPLGKGSIESVETGIKDCEIKIKPGEIKINGSVSTSLNGINVFNKKTEDLPQAEASISKIESSINESSIVISGQELVWHTGLNFNIGGLSLEIDQGKMADIELGTLDLKNAEINQNQELNIESFTLSGLNIFLTRDVVEEALNLSGDMSTDEKDESSQKEEKSKIDTIKKIQTHLKNMGLYEGIVDGVFGSKTQAAVDAFCDMTGLKLTGNVLNEMIKALDDHSTGKPVSINLGQFALTDGARIHFEDKKSEPTVDIETTIEIAEIKGLNSSDKQSMAEAKLLGDINGFTKLNIEASIGGIDPESNIEFNGSIENIELHTYSPYTAEFAGFVLNSGQLSVLTSGVSKEGSLDGVLTIELEDLDFTPKSEQDMENLKGKTGLPVETLIGFLEDGDGKINLELPVGGTISKPEVDIKPAIYKGVGGILKKVFPPTFVASILLSDANGQMSFKPIEFSPGSKKMDSEAKAYSDSVLAILNEQPKLSLDLCGRSTYEDLAAKAKLPSKQQVKEGQQQGSASSVDNMVIPDEVLKKYEDNMIDLAVERTEAVRTYLIDKKGADPGRVAECRPTFDAYDMGLPRVDITF